MQSVDYFRAKSLGPEAMAVRAGGLSGRVIAVLRDAAYLGCEGGRIIGIVGGEVDGPLTLRVDNVSALLYALKVNPDAGFHAAENALYIAGVGCIEWRRVAVWRPTLPQIPGSNDARNQAAFRLAEAIMDVGQIEGSGQVVAQYVIARRAQLVKAVSPNGESTANKSACYPLQSPPTRAGGKRSRSASEVRLRMSSPHMNVPGGAANPHNPISTRIEASLSNADEAIQTRNWPVVADALTALIGLGPGLTPSGDDLVAGIAASLVWQERLGTAPFELTNTLIEAVRKSAPTRTNRISARLLWHACEGLLYSPAMDLGPALLSGDVGAILPSARQLFSIGHTTGVDLASGLLFGSILSGKLAR